MPPILRALAARRSTFLLLAVAAAPFLPGALDLLRHGLPDVLWTRRRRRAGDPHAARRPRPPAARPLLALPLEPPRPGLLLSRARRSTGSAICAARDPPLRAGDQLRRGGGAGVRGPPPARRSVRVRRRRAAGDLRNDRRAVSAVGRVEPDDADPAAGPALLSRRRGSEGAPSARCRRWRFVASAIVETHLGFAPVALYLAAHRRAVLLPRALCRR